jgi:pantetheine-phosphate adenylyltransferase
MHAIYPGSFDPFTKGHLDIFKKAAKTFDTVTVALGINPSKDGRFIPTEKALELIAESIEEAGLFRMYSRNDGTSYVSGDDRVNIISYTDTIPSVAERVSSTHLVRGLRQVSDFNDEFRLHGIMQRNAPELTTIHIICETEFLHVSSSTARELMRYNMDIEWLVMPCVTKHFETMR